MGRERSNQLIEHLDKVQQEQPQMPTYWFACSYDLLDDNGKGVDALILEACKSWYENGEYRQTSVVLDMVEGQQGAQRLDIEAEHLNALQKTEGLQAAIHEAEKLAVARGFMEANREDPRFFTEGPPDPFGIAQSVADPMAIYREEIAAMEQKRESNAHLEGVDWFKAMFGETLFEPLDNTVNYAVVVHDADPWTVELAVDKYWKDEAGQIGMDSLTLQTFDAETGREQAETARQNLLEVHDERGLEGLMHQAEVMAIEQTWFDSQRFDGRLFRDGPSDRFETQAQQRAGEINPYWNTENTNSDWRLETFPAQTPEGEPLGHALFCIREGEQGTQMLEMAHFKDEKAVATFEKDFRGYLIPGVVDGPELAEAVAQLEGHSAQWQPLEGQELADYREAKMTVTHMLSDWHLYNPNAEQEARIAAENPGISIDF